MNLMLAYQKLLELDAQAFDTQDAAIFLSITNAHASQILRRLRATKQIIKLRHGRWAIPGKVDILELPELLTAPFPSYVSLQTALYYHEMIEQIPAVTYAVSLARTDLFQTDIGTVSIHHVQAGFFHGFDVADDTNIKMASPEKAIIDLLYLSPAKTRLFASLPELSFPENFDFILAQKYIAEIPPGPRVAMVEKLFKKLVRKT